MQKLSSDFTFLMKYIFPVAWFVLMGWGTLGLITHPAEVVYNGVRGSAPPSAKWSFLVMWLGGTAVSLWFGRRLKRVVLDGDTLIVSNYFSESRIPLSAVFDVKERGWLDRTISIEFIDPSLFGGAVHFMPVGRSRLAFWREDEMVTELRRLVAEHSPDAP